jgi:basic membrane protein A and related proteins
MFGSTSDQVKGGKLFGDFMQYGYDTAPVTGASLQYGEGKAFNPNVPAAVVKQVDDTAEQLKRGALKITPTENDARSHSSSPPWLAGPGGPRQLLDSNSV